jgi:hypothetical protein
MYELKIDKKILRRAAIQNTILGIFLLFSMTHAIYPIYSHYSGNNNSSEVAQKERYFQETGFKFGINRNTFSILAGMIGGFIGYGMKTQTARDWQRRRDLKNLIKQGQKNEKA